LASSSSTGSDDPERKQKRRIPFPYAPSRHGAARPSSPRPRPSHPTVTPDRLDFVKLTPALTWLRARLTSRRSYTLRCRRSHLRPTHPRAGCWLLLLDKAIDSPS
jgi:hypothetical protein